MAVVGVVGLAGVVGLLVLVVLVGLVIVVLARVVVVALLVFVALSVVVALGFVCLGLLTMNLRVGGLRGFFLIDAFLVGFVELFEVVDLVTIGPDVLDGQERLPRQIGGGDVRVGESRTHGEGKERARRE